MIQDERIQPLNDTAVRPGRYVLYWMQASQREQYNHALEHAVEQGNRLNRPVVVLFGLTDRYPEANLRHYAFMLQGLRETQPALRRRGIRMVVLRRSPEKAAADFAADACMLVTDAGYTRVQKQWRADVAAGAPCLVVQVETDVVVPVEVVSGKEEYAAATVRPKIHRHWKRFLVPLKRRPVRRDSLGLRLGGMELSKLDAALAELKIDRSVGPVKAFQGGTSRARRLLRAFLSGKLADYADRRNDPALGIQSHVSPYLHFGQVSPLYVALQVLRAHAPKKAKDAYLEELIVRRELSMNFVNCNPRYDSFEALPNWAKNTLRLHRRDRRPVIYSSAELEAARTHDPYWNAAMREMLLTGKMHNYMRMYWGKKILEWSRTPQQAFRTALRLNNKYFLDGRDPNSFAGVAWCFGKHDRPWAERNIFGKTRYMNAAGLERKFDMAAYVGKVESLQEEPPSQAHGWGG